MKDRQRKKTEVTTAQNEMSHVMRQHEPWHVEMKEPKSLVSGPCMLPLYRPFTAVVAGHSGCGKTARN